MKNLLTLLFLFVSLNLFAANPSFVDVTNIFNAQHLIFDGDSLTADGFDNSRGEESPHYAYIPPFGYGNDWPTLLMTKSNYTQHGYIQKNWARGSESATNTVANRFATNAALSLVNPGYKMYFLNIGINDLNIHEAAYEITNALQTLWGMARAYPNTKVVAFTITTNTAGWNPTDTANSLIVNNWIRTNITKWDYMVDAAALQTNLTTQLGPDGLHWTAFFENQIAEYVNRYVPPTTRQWNRLGSAGNRYQVSLVSSNILGLENNIFYSAMIRETLNTFSYDSDGLCFYYQTNANFGKPISTIRSIRNSGGVWEPLEIVGAEVFVLPQSSFGVLSVTNPTEYLLYSSNHISFREQLELIGDTCIITNTLGPTIYFGTTNSPTFPAAAGSIYTSTGAGTAGQMYFHTNTSIATSWYPVKLN